MVVINFRRRRYSTVAQQRVGRRYSRQLHRRRTKGRRQCAFHEGATPSALCPGASDCLTWLQLIRTGQCLLCSLQYIEKPFRLVLYLKVHAKVNCDDLCIKICVFCKFLITCAGVHKLFYLPQRAGQLLCFDKCY